MSGWNNGFQGASNPPYFPNGLWGVQNITQARHEDEMGDDDDMDVSDEEMMSTDEMTDYPEPNNGFYPPGGLFHSNPIPIPGNESYGNTEPQNPFGGYVLGARPWEVNPMNQDTSQFSENIRNLAENACAYPQENREGFFGTRIVQAPAGENPPPMPVFDIFRSNLQNPPEAGIINPPIDSGTLVFPRPSDDNSSHDLNRVIQTGWNPSPPSDSQQISEILEAFNDVGDIPYFDIEEPPLPAPSVVQLYDDPLPPNYRSSYISPIAQAVRDEEDEGEVYNIGLSPQFVNFPDPEINFSDDDEPIWRPGERSSPLKREYSFPVEERRELRHALELSEHLDGGVKPSKYTQLLLPSDQEQREAQLNYEHLRVRIVRNEIQDVPVDSNFNEFMGLFENTGVFHELPSSIIDEGVEHSRDNFILRFESRLRPIYNESPSSLSGSSLAQVEAIRKTLKQLYLKLSDELANIQLLDGEHQRNAFEEFKSKIKKYFIEIGHGTLHCNDRIAQECELIYGEEFRGLGLSINSSLSVEDKILNNLQAFRDQLLRQVIAEIPRKYPRFSRMDVATNIQHFQAELGEELNLSASAGTIYDGFVNRDALDLIRSEFNKNYTAASIVGHLRNSCNFGDLYRWFDERYDVENLGYQISNENVDFLSDSALMYLLQKMEVIH